MQNVIKQLSMLPTKTIIAHSIINSIGQMPDSELIREVREMMLDNPQTMTGLLGQNLFNEILNAELC